MVAGVVVTVAAGAVVVAVAVGVTVFGVTVVGVTVSGSWWPSALGVAEVEGVAEGLETVLVDAAALRLVSVAWRASTPTPPAPTVANAASPAVTAVT